MFWGQFFARVGHVLRYVYLVVRRELQVELRQFPEAGSTTIKVQIDSNSLSQLDLDRQC